MKKRDLILIVIALVLFGAYLILRQRKPVEKPVSIFQTDSLSIHTIRITNPEESLVIEKRDDEWWLVEPVEWKADTDMMQRFFRNVIKADMPSTVMSTGANAIIRYDLDDASALQIKVYDKRGKLKEHVYFGNSGAPHDYLRFDGSDNVYQIQNKVVGSFQPHPGYWRDPTVLGIMEEDIAQMHIKYSRGDYNLIRKDRTWTYKSSNEEFEIHPDNRQVMRILNILELLQTRVFLDGDNSSFKESFQQPHLHVVITLNDGKKRELRFVRDGRDFLLMVDNNLQTLFYTVGDTPDRFTRASMVFKEVYEM